MPYVEYDEVEAICPECGRNFRSEETLELHRQDAHAGIESPPDRPRRKAGRTQPAPRIDESPVRGDRAPPE